MRLGMRTVVLIREKSWRTRPVPFVCWVDMRWSLRKIQSPGRAGRYARLPRATPDSRLATHNDGSGMRRHRGTRDRAGPRKTGVFRFAMATRHVLDRPSMWLHARPGKTRRGDRAEGHLHRPRVRALCWLGYRDPFFSCNP